MQQDDQAGLAFNPTGVPPSQAEIDAYVEELRPKSAAAKRKASISSLCGSGGVFGFLLIALTPSLQGPPDYEFFLGIALICGALFSWMCGKFYSNLFETTHVAIKDKINNCEAASFELLEELSDMVTNTGIRPEYLARVAKQERELVATEVRNLKGLITALHAERKRA